jgi:hypothetical protein
MKKESPCGFSSASAIIWYCEYCSPVSFHDIYTSFATSFFQVVGNPSPRTSAASVFSIPS